MAPEVLRWQDYDEKVDVWSATVCIYTLLFGVMPYNSNSQDDILKMIEAHEDTVGVMQQAKVPE